MRDDHHRMGGLHLILTGWSGRPAPAYPDIPRHLWGDVGLRDDGCPRPRRAAAPSAAEPGGRSEP